jgi:LAO/AO transport system kinase
MSSATVSLADIENWANACRNGDRRAASRLITALESGNAQTADAAGTAVADFALPRHTIGITGPPGAGKSTLVDYLTGLFRARGERVAVLAIDPSSPFTGGALLGDRIRMSSHRNDGGVFIRSMGSRGATGGLALAAAGALRALAAAGYPVALIETVGSGQSEIDVGHLADTVCVVQVPGLGDDVQLMKMGQLEIADVFVVNKADRPGAEDLKLQLQEAIHALPGSCCRSLRQLDRNARAQYAGPDWTPPVLAVSALSHTGGAEVLAAFDAHRAFTQSPELARLIALHRVRREVLWRAGLRFQSTLLERLEGGDLSASVEAVVNGTLSLQDAAAQALAQSTSATVRR